LTGIDAPPILILGAFAAARSELVAAFPPVGEEAAAFWGGGERLRGEDGFKVGREAVRRVLRGDRARGGEEGGEWDRIKSLITSAMVSLGASALSPYSFSPSSSS